MSDSRRRRRGPGAEKAALGDEKAALRQVNEIRRIVEASGRFTLLSGAAGLTGGAASIVGALLTHRVIVDAGGLERIGREAVLRLGEIWLGVLAVALVALLVGTIRRARGEGHALLPRLLARIGFGLAPSFLVASVLTVALVSRGAIDLVAPLWILCYGAAAITAGLFSVRSVQVLGAAFLAAGIVSIIGFTSSPALTLGITFGGFHILYGMAVWRIHGA